MEFSIQKTPIDLLKEIAEKHRVIRKQLKMSQTELAERSGVSLGSLKRFENTGKISLEALLKLSNILGRLADFEKIFNQKENLEDIEQLFSDKTRKL